MTTIDFINKQLKKSKINLDKAQRRTGTTQSELDALKEKINHYEAIAAMLYKLERNDAK